MPELMIKAENLSKCYLVGHQASAGRGYTALRDVMAHATRTFTRKIRDCVAGRQILGGEEFEEFWALKDLNFEVSQGEVLGIIGKNGAGKSTLLKILSRITVPTQGQIRIKGRVASLLEVGTGFHPELTGRENVYLNGAILGMTRSEIKRKFDEIIAFAEVEQFLDTPVKRYSSGMYVRLAFAVAAHLQPEILLVDEVLAVGDAEFQKRCLGKMGDVARSGRTVLFVSHNLGAVRALCQRAILLRGGQIVADTSVDGVIATYLDENRDGASGRGRWVLEAATKTGTAGIESLTIELRGARSGVSDQVSPDEDLELRFRYRQRGSLSGERFGFQLLTGWGEVAFTATDHQARGGSMRPPGDYVSTCTIPGGLLNTGIYRMRFWAGIPASHTLVDAVDVGAFTVVGIGNQGLTVETDNWPGVVCPKLAWRVESD